MKKERIIFIIGIITIIISSIISVYAANYLYNSNEVSYNNSSSGISSDNVQGAIDELYEKATDYNTLSTKVGDASLNTTAQDLSGAVNELNSKVYTRHICETVNNGVVINVAYPSGFNNSSKVFIQPTYATGYLLFAIPQSNNDNYHVYFRNGSTSIPKDGTVCWDELWVK